MTTAAPPDGLLTDDLLDAPTAAPPPPVARAATEDRQARREPATVEVRRGWEHGAVYVFVVGPVLALLAVLLWGPRPSLVDVAVSVVFFALTGLGVTVGFHRCFTHGSFKPNRPLKIALAIAGSLSVEGPVARWVSDHRKHHANSDAEGDPHSPWRYGDGYAGVARGLWWSHTGWLFNKEKTSQERYAPDLLADEDLVRVSRWFPLWVVVTLVGPAALGGLLSWSWYGMWTAFLWAGVIRILAVHHVTWSVNSICHVVGNRPFRTRDRSTNVWALALLSHGESWHNFHHAEPTSARHGVDRFQFDTSARLIELFEWLGWARDVRWPRQERVERKRAV